VLQRSNQVYLAKYGGMVDSHAISNPVISDVKRGKKRIKTESLSLAESSFFLRMCKSVSLGDHRLVTQSPWHRQFSEIKGLRHLLEKKHSYFFDKIIRHLKF